MEKVNQTSSVSKFLLGFSFSPGDQKPFFALFFIMYMVTLGGNLLIILAICSDTQLQTPIFLATMAIDRFVAICDPFHYVTTMSHCHCVLLLAFSCSIPDLHSLLLVLLINASLSVTPMLYPHFLCNINPLLKLSCSSTFANEVVINTEGLITLMTPFICVIISYFWVLIAILKIPSAAGKHKAFSTDGSHLTMVTLFYGSIIYDRVVTVIYTVLSSMLNPLIYSLRNKDMKWGMRKLMGSFRSQTAPP
ncbi:unnamed protein product [Nyctereutes procyonoides]|uniref:(raccoon dog) hypothetical protein n=1 Tax=Nyctereutes procyonoides TaxID=34880 RepID=A0A811XX88_NYCPR|nr:unnamed protein product [Nyctereutes procyonoides]